MSEERWHNWIDTADGRYVDEAEADEEIDRLRAQVEELSALWEEFEETQDTDLLVSELCKLVRKEEK
jgi:hypothetical protein